MITFHRSWLQLVWPSKHARGLAVQTQKSQIIEMMITCEFYLKAGRGAVEAWWPTAACVNVLRT